MKVPGNGAGKARVRGPPTACALGTSLDIVQRLLLLYSKGKCELFQGNWNGCIRNSPRGANKRRKGFCSKDDLHEQKHISWGSARICLWSTVYAVSPYIFFSVASPLSLSLSLNDSCTSCLIDLFFQYLSSCKHRECYSKFNHPNIVRLHWIQWDPPRLRIILELMEGGDLRSFLREARPTHVSRFVFRQLWRLILFCFRKIWIHSICAFWTSSTSLWT